MMELAQIHSRHPRFSQAGHTVSRHHAAVGQSGGVSRSGAPHGRALSRLPASHVVAAAEARGFIFAAPLALELNAGFVPVRKPGKLPFDTHAFHYELEYGTDTLEIHRDGIAPGQKVLLVDDLLATGGTMEACCRLVEHSGAQVAGCVFLIELVGLGGAERLAALSAAQPAAILVAVTMLACRHPPAPRAPGRLLDRRHASCIAFE